MLTKENEEIKTQDSEFVDFTEEDLNQHKLSKNEVEKATAMLAASAAKKKKKQEIAIELQYSRVVASNPDIAVVVQEEAVYMYQWAGNHWKPVSEHDAKKQAHAWLELMAPEFANDRKAGECYRTALLKAKPLPPAPTATVIPFQDRWLEVTDSSDFMVVEPDKRVGITYEIAAKLDQPVGPYVPAPVPTNSRLHKFLNTSVPAMDSQELLQEYSGYTLIPDTRHQKALVNTGDGSNGKSVYIAIVSALHRKIAAMRLDRLDSFGTYNLKDASLAISAEAPKKGINEEVLKSCISGDIITLEGKFKNQFEYAPKAKWIVSCNRFPKIEDESNGVWRRLMIVEWKVVIEEGSKDIVLDLDKLIIKYELIHFVNWCLIGLQRLLVRGKFNIPETVKAATAKEKEMSNSVLPFVADTILEESAVSVMKEEVYNRYRDYCEQSGLMPYGNAEFWRRLKARFPKMREERKRVGGEFKRYVYLSFTGEVEAAMEQKLADVPQPYELTTEDKFEKAMHQWKMHKSAKEEMEVF